MGEQIHSSVFSLSSALDGSDWSTPHPGRFNPGKETRYLFCRSLYGPQRRSGRVSKKRESLYTHWDRTSDRPTVGRRCIACVITAYILYIYTEYRPLDIDVFAYNDVPIIILLFYSAVQSIYCVEWNCFGVMTYNTEIMVYFKPR
jgi:hypothetical protein